MAAPGYKTETIKVKKLSLTKLIGAGFFGLVGLLLLLGSFTTIPSGYRGVVTHFGKVQENILDEGFHFKMPISTTIHKISVRVQKTESNAEAASKDIQKVHATVALNWNVDPTTVNSMYQNVGNEEDVAENIISPAVAEVLKASVSKRTAEEVLTKRLELKAEIDEMLIARLSHYNIKVRDISLVNLDFTQQFNQAVEAKQIEEQNAKRAEYSAVRAQKEAMATVNTAKGDAEAVEIRAKAQARAQEMLRQSITANILQQQAIDKWNGILPQIIGGSGTIPMIDLKNLTPSK